MAHPTRVHILDMLSEGPSSPTRMQRRMENISLNLVSHHVKVLRELGCIELVETVPKRGGKEHIYRARERQFFTDEEWEAVDPKIRQPITSIILRMISEDAGRSLAEGKFDELVDNHRIHTPTSGTPRNWPTTALGRPVASSLPPRRTRAIIRSSPRRFTSTPGTT